MDMATGQEVLKFYGIEQQDAMSFITANIDNPEVIFNVALQYGITTQHLSDITGYDSLDISIYFQELGMDPHQLNDVRILANTLSGDFVTFARGPADDFELSKLIDFNNQTGVLSNASLREQIKADLDNSPMYDAFFQPVFGYQNADGLYTPDETGVSRLGNFEATSENLESIFFGTLINILNSAETEEMDQIASSEDINETVLLIADALIDKPTESLPDNLLEYGITLYGTDIIMEYFSEGNTTIGILDGTPYLGQILL